MGSVIDVKDAPCVKLCPICLTRSQTTPLCAAIASSSVIKYPPA